MPCFRGLPSIFRPQALQRMSPRNRYACLTFRPVLGLARGPQTARRFGSREDTNNAPQLLIDYTPPPPLIDLVQVSGNQFNLFFTAASNQAYIVEFRNSLSATNWQTLANVGPFSDNTRVLVIDPISHTERFYRARPN